MPRPPGAKTPLVRPRPVAKRVWASLEREPWEVVAEATLEAERQDPEHVKHWVALVDGAETQLDLVEASAAAYGVDVTVILDIIHGGRVRLEGGACVPSRGEPRVGVLGLDARAVHSRGQGQQGGGGDAACGDRRRLVERHPQAGRLRAPTTC